MSDEGDHTDIMELAKPIDLTADRAKLNADLSRLLKREGRVYERTGVECDIKWLDGGDKLSCSTCPYSRADAEDGGGPLGTICRIGLAQERTLVQLDQHKKLDELEELAERVFMTDELEELAELAAELV